MLSDLPPLGETVRRHGLRADKSLGQHFLLDPSITVRIASLCDLGGDTPTTVLEVGPGPGGLTRSLIAAGAERVVAVEMDPRFLPALEEIAEATDRLDIVQGDALKTDLRDHLPPLSLGGHIVASNLPYNVGTKLLLNWLTEVPRRWHQLVLMFQLEVAERVVAAPDTPAYGRLAVLSQSVASAHIAFRVPAGAFSPPPKVDSAVVVLRPLDGPYPDLANLENVTRAAFGQRRKMLRAALKGLAKSAGVKAESWLKAAGIDPTARAETVPVEGFHRLTDTWTQILSGDR